MRVAACGLSSGGVVVRYQGDTLGIFIISLVPASLGSSACAVTIFHGEGVLVSTEQLKDSCQIAMDIP